MQTRKDSLLMSSTKQFLNINLNDFFKWKKAPIEYYIIVYVNLIWHLNSLNFYYERNIHFPTWQYDLVTSSLKRTFSHQTPQKHFSQNYKHTKPISSSKLQFEKKKKADFKSLFLSLRNTLISTAIIWPIWACIRKRTTLLLKA